LPLGIAVSTNWKKINETGLQIPNLSSIYEPVLEELKPFDIVFRNLNLDC